MITFNFKKAKAEEVEKYAFPVLTQLAYTGEKNSVAKFELNKAALKALGYDEDLKGSKLSIGMVDNMLVIANTTGLETDHQFNVNMNGSVNSKFLLDRINKHFEIDETVDNEFKLIVGETDGVKYAHLDINMEVVEKEEVSAEEMLDGVLEEEQYASYVSHEHHPQRF